MIPESQTDRSKSGNIYDFLTVGGGPAGASTALSLAKLKFRVALLERNNPSVDKICGEFFSPESVLHLENLGLKKEFLSLKPALIDSIRTCDKNRDVLIKLPQTAYGLQRKLFDEMLLNSAAASGTDLFTRYNVNSILRSVDLMEVNVLDRNNNINKTFRAKHIIGAVGAKSGSEKLLIGKKNGSESQRNGTFSAFKIHGSTLNKLNSVELFFVPGGYIGTAPVSDTGLINICSLLTTSLFKERGGSFEALLAYFSETNPYFKERLKTISFRSPPMAVSNLRFGFQQNSDKNIIPVGDAMGRIHPFSGEGISMALESALLLEHAVRTSHARNLRENYLNLWHKKFSRRIKMSKLVNTLISGRLSLSLSFRLVSRYPSLIQTVFNNTREIQI